MGQRVQYIQNLRQSLNLQIESASKKLFVAKTDESKKMFQDELNRLRELMRFAETLEGTRLTDGLIKGMEKF